MSAFDLNFGFYAPKCSHGTPPEVWNQPILSKNADLLHSWLPRLLGRQDHFEKQAGDEPVVLNINLKK